MNTEQVIASFIESVDVAQSSDSPFFVSSAILYAHGTHWPMAVVKEDDNVVWINADKRGSGSATLLKEVMGAMQSRGQAYILSDLGSLKQLIQVQS